MKSHDLLQFSVMIMCESDHIAIYIAMDLIIILVLFIYLKKLSKTMTIPINI